MVGETCWAGELGALAAREEHCRTATVSMMKIPTTSKGIRAVRRNVSLGLSFADSSAIEIPLGLLSRATKILSRHLFHNSWVQTSTVGAKLTFDEAQGSKVPQSDVLTRTRCVL
jgi:hypothetical protein